MKELITNCVSTTRILKELLDNYKHSAYQKAMLKIAIENLEIGLGEKTVGETITVEVPEGCEGHGDTHKFLLDEVVGLHNFDANYRVILNNGESEHFTTKESYDRIREALQKSKRTRYGIVEVGFLPNDFPIKRKIRSIEFYDG